MHRVIRGTAVLIFTGAVFLAPVLSRAQDRPEKIEVGRTIVSKTKNVTTEHVKIIKRCGGPVFKLKAGMTPQEAADAIDDGYNRHFECMRTMFR